MSGGTITNCILDGTAFINSNSFKNCILIGTGSGIDHLFEQDGNNSVQNNICKATQEEIIDSKSDVFNFGTDNLFGKDLSAAFVGITGNSQDGRYKLSVTSPAKGIGVGGIDAGIFGGSDPYILSGIPPVPNVYQINVATDGTGVVTIKARSNN